ncbi:DUF3488 and transglutaminase-like domain-containing protein [Algiphilus sp. W345]|uniref:DUF3488 and transglutaminase-like domain-containing protein n=1 Tax=Banduia mediterranea TaxID=3075609 RepID=A0ABU2WGG8_9GAMM|nr:DUF3488 and transglutaminase-like domain-containing protein [Algiphilus sp. W345]MDT0496971.1 DUF3488 and transglutaminase-like domain-containing protein [Algiphilus sp. W345]
MAAVAADDYLSRNALLRLLAVMFLVIAPHAPHLPLWAGLVSLLLLVWRATATFRQWALPPRWVRFVLSFAAFAGIWASYGRVNSQTAGTALFVLMLSLKLTEMRSRRDVTVVVFLLYFVLLTHFLYSQELWTLPYMLGCAVAITAVLGDANHPGAALPWRTSLGLGARVIALALPLMLVLFVLFPRIPGPLWGLPSDSGAGRTGLSDSLSPGDISSLIESHEVAFRVSFDGAPPPPAQRYWRGPSFWSFDGYRWEPGYRGNEHEHPPLEWSGDPVDYLVTLEPQARPWLMALEMPVPSALPATSRLGPDYQLIATKPVSGRRAYRLRSYPNYRLQPELPDLVRRLSLRLPRDANPKTRDYALRLRTRGLSDRQIVDQVLNRFREQEYFYTLNPPRLGRDSVDDFLFSTKRGFCEHYASSFTALMRATGIPARVVTGYLGGEINEIGGYMVVRQSDAHAWSEVWLEGQGWVRVDPTAAVAPSRIETGVEGALDAVGERMPGSLFSTTRLRYWIEARWDWVNASWNGLVLGYGPELQRTLLSRFGVDSLRSMILVLTGMVVTILAVISLFTLRRLHPPAAKDRAQRLWRGLQRRLARIGLVQRPDEGAGDFARRVAKERPELAASVGRMAALYQSLRYLDGEDAATEKALRLAISRFQP